MSNISKILSNNTVCPKHIVVVMDGNGRWAKRRFLPRIAGHHRAIKAVRDIIKTSIKNNIKILTLFAFSSENWQRPALEVDALMSLLLTCLQDEIERLNDNKVKLNIIGDLSRLAEDLKQAINNAEFQTKNNDGLVLNIALNYGGRWDIVQATRRISEDVIKGNIKSSDINENLMQEYISLAEYPEPDLLIRTSGEQRISNFLLWQLAYTELYFTPVLWPDFCEKDFNKALSFFAGRKRRFGHIENFEPRYAKDKNYNS